MMHITMEHIAIKRDYARPIFARSVELWIYSMIGLDQI